MSWWDVAVVFVATVVVLTYNGERYLRQLLDVVATKLTALRLENQQASDDLGATQPAAEVADEHVDAQACLGWCPICRSAELLKGERPELTQKFLDAALLVITTLRSLIPQPPSQAHTQDPTEGDGSTGIERIEIR